MEWMEVDGDRWRVGRVGFFSMNVGNGDGMTSRNYRHLPMR